MFVLIKSHNTYYNDKHCEYTYISGNTWFEEAFMNMLIVYNPEILYHDSVIKSWSTAKLLGVTVNNSLSWNDHIETVINKYIYYILYMLSRIKLNLSTDNRKRFYNAYILPYFDFGCVIWGNCTHNLEHKLVKLQKKAARVILDFSSWTCYLSESYSNV